MFKMVALVCGLVSSNPAIVDGCFAFKNNHEFNSKEDCVQAMEPALMGLANFLVANNELDFSLENIECVSEGDPA